MNTFERALAELVWFGLMAAALGVVVGWTVGERIYRLARRA